MLFRSKHTFSMDKHHRQKSGSPAKEDSSSPSPSTPPPDDSPQVEPKPSGDQEPTPIATVEEENDDKQEEKPEETTPSAASAELDADLLKLAEEVDQFIASHPADVADQDPPEIPESIERFVKLVQVEIVKCVSSDAPSTLFDEPAEGELSVLDTIDKISKLTSVLKKYQDEKDPSTLLNLTSTVLQRAMSFLEEEFRNLVEIPRASNLDTAVKRISVTKDFRFKKSSIRSFKDPDHGVQKPQEEEEQQSETNNGDENLPGYSEETINILRKLAAAMISSGYETECSQTFSIARRTAFEEGLNKLGFAKISIDDVQKMQWETLGLEISTWRKVIKQAINVYFPGEQRLCGEIFAQHPTVAENIFNSLTGNVVLQLLNFAEAVAMTKRSNEKLFKFLDMYETLREIIPTINDLFSDDSTREIRSESQSSQARLGEAMVLIFCDLENSIKSDTAKAPVPGGAVHPLTRYTINYIKYAACEYKETLEQVFQEHKEIVSSPRESDADDSSTAHNNQTYKPSPFAEQLLKVFDLLDENLEAKSKLYKDLPLSYIFLMNNGRYILQKLKESPEIYNLLGNAWSRKQSSNLRQYHKNYQRETWSKVLVLLRDDGLMVHGKVLKPALKERFKTFNAMFDEIHKTQTTWIVTDQQLQSELQVSISAVVIPAYRSFLARFRQHLDPGRQAEKYIKYGPEDIETLIGDLFSKKP